MNIANSSTFSIVVPLFNEEENVVPLVEKILAAVGDDPDFLEAVLVDDGSRDKTAPLVVKLARLDKRIRLVRHDRNRGLGAAISTGLAAARGDQVLYTDADLPFDFDLMPVLLSAANGGKVVTGYRLNRGEGPRRWILTKGYNLIIWLCFGLYMRDVNFACKILPRRFLLEADLKSEGSFIDVEILLESRKLGLEISETPLVYHPREHGVSTLSRPSVILRILSEMYGYIFGRYSHAALLDLIGASPIGKMAVLLVTILTAIVLVAVGIRFDQVLPWIALIGEAGVASILFNSKTGIAASSLQLVSIEVWTMFLGQPFTMTEHYHVLAWGLVAIPLSQLGPGGWKLIQRSLRLTPSE